MKQEAHAVRGNCSAKCLYPSHCQAASRHINGGLGYLSGAHINLNVAAKPGGESVLTAAQKCVELVSSGHHRSAHKAEPYSQCSEDWSLSLEKSLKELEENSWRLRPGLNTRNFPDC